MTANLFVDKLPATPKVWSFLKTWKPDRDMRMWMKGQSPIWVHNVPDVFAKEYAFDPALLDNLAFRIVADTIERVGYADSLSGIAQLPSADPKWPWQRADGTWIMAAQEITLRHLVWAHDHAMEKGFHQVSNCAKAMFVAYYNSKAWSYLKDGGKPSQPYMNRGRHRTLRGCIDMCDGLLRMSYDDARLPDWAAKWVTDLLASHIERAAPLFPLVDDPAGDHLSVPFVSVYQSATLWSILDKAEYAWDIPAETNVKIAEMKYWIESLVDVAALPDDSGFYYDCAVVDGVPVYVPEMEEQKNGTYASVAAWCVPMLLSMKARGHERATKVLAKLTESAISTKAPQENPESPARLFGTTVLA